MDEPSLRLLRVGLPQASRANRHPPRRRMLLSMMQPVSGNVHQRVTSALTLAATLEVGPQKANPCGH